MIDQAGAALGVLVDLDDRALGDRAAAGAVGLLDALRGRRSARRWGSRGP